jgi:Flp pilus assembly protein TadG
VYWRRNICLIRSETSETTVLTMLNHVFNGLLCLLKDRSASTAMMFAMAMPPLLGAVGFASDMALLHMKRTQLQAAADQAALGATNELTIAGYKEENVKTVATVFAKNALTNQSKAFSVDATIDNKVKSVEVKLTEEWAPFFAHYLDANVTPIVVKSKAQLVGQSNLCLLSLDNSGARAVHLDNRARLDAKSCAIHANSTNPNAVSIDADAVLKAAQTCSVGGAKVNRKSSATPEIMLDCTPFQDPLAARPQPAVSACKEKKQEISTGTVSLIAGTYCNSLTITGSARVHFTPGIYVIKDGELTISGNAIVTGTNVSFFFTGKNSLIKFLDQAEISLSGQEAGPMAGLLFQEDRSNKAGGNHKISSEKVRELTGTIYLPKGDLSIDPNAPIAEESAYTAIIVQKLKLSEGPELVLNSDYSSTSVPLPKGVNYQPTVVLSK